MSLAAGVALLMCVSATAYAETTVVDERSIATCVPVYVNGLRVEPVNGQHHLVLSREDGIVINGVPYMPVTPFPKYVPAVKADGFHYAVDGAHRAANAAYEAGEGRDAAKEAMVAFWRREFGDDLAVTQTGEYDFRLEYKGQSVGVTVTNEDGYHPENQAVDNFKAVQSRFDMIAQSIGEGYLVLAGQAYARIIQPGDIGRALKEIDALAKSEKVIPLIDQARYEGEWIVDGKYRLSASIINDLVSSRDR
jgi:hypothetical protein